METAQTVQRAGGRLLIEPTKTEASEVPLPKVTRTALEPQRERQGKERVEARECWWDHDLVFATQIGTPVVTLLLTLGVPPHIVQAIARHADVDVTMSIYAHLDPDAMRKAMESIAWEEDL